MYDRCLPAATVDRPDSDTARHFVVIGAQKSGTTGLYMLLRGQPDIAMSFEKETNYFARPRNGAPSLKEYHTLFPETVAGRWRGEASPVYTMEHEYPGVAERLHAVLPDARLIYIVRDPFKRALSQYQHDYLSGRFTLENGRISRGDLERFVETSRYHRQLSPYLRYFDLADMLIIEFDDLVADQGAVAQDVRTFLGLPPLQLIAETEHRHNTGEERSQVPRFVLRSWNSLPFRLARRYLSDDFRRSLRGVYRLFPQRTVPPLDEAAQLWIREALADDVAAFRAMTARPFARWCI